jgi:hypothetical protein
MRDTARAISAAWCVLAILPRMVEARMELVPPPVLTEAAQTRFEAISFFLLVLLSAAFVVRWLWNRLTADSALPRLTYPRALGVVLTWGSLCLVVLTMVATTREMMTPGVWAKQGFLYGVPGDSKAETPVAKPSREAKP